MDHLILRTRRKALGLRVYDLASIAHMSPFVIMRIERGQRELQPQESDVIAAVLGTLEQARTLAENQVALIAEGLAAQ